MIAFTSKLFTTEQVAELLHVKARTVKAWVAKNKLTAMRVGNRLLFSESDIEAFLTKSRSQ